MKKFILPFMVLTTVQLHGVGRLTGTPIGTQQCVDYATGQPSTTVHTVETLFDGDFNTYFATYQRSYTWGGLDLGEKHVITRVGYAPRADYWEGPDRVKMAVIQGANSPDWLDAVPLCIITESAEVNKMNYIDVNCSKGFRYVRYVGPSDKRCNLAELEFWGEKGEGDDTQMFQFTNLPTVIINTVDSQEPYDKEHDIPGNVIILDGRKYDTDAEATVRERGNTSRSHPKKPWRIKFNKKQNVLDAPAKAKKWTLINNHSDKTLMRNIVAFELSRIMELDYTPYCQPVDVVLNGEFKGCYQLCDQVEVNKGRIPVTEMEPTDTEGEALTGGYHFEIDSYANQEPEGSWFYSEKSKIPVTIKSPDDGGTYEQFNYIYNYFSEFEKRCIGTTLRNAMDPVKGYRPFLDLDSYLRYFIIEEFIANVDCVWSMHMHKERGDSLMKCGPVWDSELSFDNGSLVYPSNSFDFMITTSGKGATVKPFLDLHKRIFAFDTKAVKRRNFLYSAARNDRNFTPEHLIAFIDSCAEEIRASADLNFKRWDVLGRKVFTEPRVEYSYDEALNNLKEFILKRFEKLDSDRFFKYDPDVHFAAVTLPHADPDSPETPDVIIDNGTIALSDPDTDFTVTGIDGRTYYSGRGICDALPRGVYIVTAAGVSTKIAL